MIKFITILLLFALSGFSKNLIIIGTIDSEPQEKIFKFQKLAEYLEQKLDDNNIKVNVEIPKDINAAITLVKDNKLNILIDSIYPINEVQKKNKMTIEAKRWKNNMEDYRSLIFVKKNSDINFISDLKGKTVAFEDDFSTSSYIIPKKAIEKKGLILSSVKNKNNVNFIYSKSEKNTATWVMFSKTDAGALDDESFKSFDKNLFKVIYTSELIPRQVVSFSKKIKKPLKNKILEILYAMHKNDEGKKVLKEFSKTKKFTPLNKNDINYIKSF